MTDRHGSRRRPSLSMPILRISSAQNEAGTLTLGNLLVALGERSFGWAIVLFSLLTLLPLPPGSSLITGLPVLLATAQMALGFPHVRLPGRVARIRIKHETLRRSLLRLRPITRRLERILAPRYDRLVSAGMEQPIGIMLFVISFALFLPVPLSGWFPAISLFIVGVGLIERDGLVVLLGLAAGLCAILLTIFLIFSFVMGADGLIHLTG